MSAPKRAPRSRTRTLEAGQEAKRLGSAVLEVLSGLRSPTEASQALGISPQRYYKLEARAVQGLLRALEAPPQGPGRRVKPEAELARVVAERDRLKRELQRALALVRAAQRSVGLAPVRSPSDGGEAKGKGKRRRTPRVRARRLAEELRREANAPAGQPPVVEPAPGQRSAS